MATFEKLENNKAKLTVTVDKDAFAAALQTAYVKTVKHYNVPGFRKGKAPRKVIENLYGEAVFFEDAFEEVWGDAYDAALTENNLIAVDKPELDITTISKEEGVVFTAVVQLKPEVTLGEYKGIEVEKPTYTVEDADVDAEIEKEREKNARFIDVERAVENGDRVMLDYSGSVDGVKFDGGTAEDQMLVIGSGSFIPGFEEQLVGMAIGEERDISVKFPEEYHAEELAGKDAIFHVTIKSVQIKELPALDDEFAKDVSEFDTLEAYRADKKKTLTEAAEKNAEAAIENAALQAACDNAAVEIPEVMVGRQVNYMLQDIAYRLQMSGMSLEDYCKFTGTDMDQLRKSYHDEAAARVKMQLVIEAVGKAENIACSAEDLDKSIADYAENSGSDKETFQKNLSDDDIEYLTDRVVAEKSVDFIVKNAKLVAAKKKPAAKKNAAAKKTESEEAPSEDSAE